MAVTGNQGATGVLGAYNLGSPVQGARATTDVQVARRIPQYTKTVKINANVTPLTAFMDKLKNEETVGGVLFFQVERDLIPLTVSTSTSYLSSDTSIVLTAGQGAGVVSGTTLWSTRTGEMMLVTARSTDTLTVTRAYGTGGAAAAALNSGEELIITGTAFAEYSAAPNGISIEPLLVNNYMQTFRQSVEMARRDMNSANYGPDEWDRAHEDAIESMNRQMEMAFLFNPAYSAGNGAASPSVTQGLIPRITTNVFNIGGTLDETTLENMQVAWSRRNQGDESSLVTFAGENFMKALDGFSRDAMRYTPQVEWLGADVVGWRCSFGEYKIKKHGLFSPLGSVNTVANGSPLGYMLGVNMKNVNRAVWKGNAGKMQYDANCKLPGVDGTKACWTRDCGLQVVNERTHVFASGITG